MAFRPGNHPHPPPLGDSGPSVRPARPRGTHPSASVRRARPPGHPVPHKGPACPYSVPAFSPSPYGSSFPPYWPPYEEPPSLEDLSIAEALRTLNPSFEDKKRLVLAAQAHSSNSVRPEPANGTADVFRPPATGTRGLAQTGVSSPSLGELATTQAGVYQQIQRLAVSSRSHAGAVQRPPTAATRGLLDRSIASNPAGPLPICSNRSGSGQVKQPTKPLGLNPNARTFEFAGAASPATAKPLSASPIAKLPALSSSWWDRSCVDQPGASRSSLKPVVSSTGILLPPVTQAGNIRSLFTFAVPFRPFPNCKLPVGQPTTGGQNRSRIASHPNKQSELPPAKASDGSSSTSLESSLVIHPYRDIEEQLQLVLRKYGAVPVAAPIQPSNGKPTKRKAKRKSVRFNDSSCSSLDSSTSSLPPSGSSSVGASLSAAPSPGQDKSSEVDLLKFQDERDLLGSSSDEGEVILIGRLIDADPPPDDERNLAGSGPFLSASIDQVSSVATPTCLSVEELYDGAQGEVRSDAGALAGPGTRSRKGLCGGPLIQQPGDSLGPRIPAEVGQGRLPRAEVISGKAQHEGSTSRFGSLATLDGPSEGGRQTSRGRKGPLILGDDLTPFSHLMRNLTVRREIPQHVRHSPTGDTLQDSMLESWAATEPTTQEKQMIPDLCSYLTQVVNQHMGGYVGMRHGQPPRFQVDVFGSMSWGGQTGQTGDIDMVVRDRLLPQGYVPTLWKNPPEEEETEDAVFGSDTAPHLSRDNLPSCYDARRLAGIMRKVAGFEDALAIVYASTPIVKFTAILGDKEYKCDLNVNDVGGWYNSRLILAYCDLSPYVLRPLVHALKLWAGVNGLNDASGAHGPATLSSYCLTLMAIAYLQHRGHLPNLQAEVLAPIPDRLQDDARDVVWCSWGKPQATKAHVGFNRQPPPGWQPREPDLNAATALRGFFAFYSHGPSAPQGLSASPNRFDYDRQVISVLHGGVLPRAEFRGQEEGEGNITKLERFRREGIMGKGDLGIQPDIWKFRQVVVQDPFIWQKNCSQTLSAIGKDRWFSAIDAANEMFAERGMDATLDDLLVQFAPMPTKLSKSAKRRVKANEAEARRASAAQQNQSDEAVGDLLPGLQLAL